MVRRPVMVPHSSWIMLGPGTQVIILYLLIGPKSIVQGVFDVTNEPVGMGCFPEPSGNSSYLLFSSESSLRAQG